MYSNWNEEKGILEFVIIEFEGNDSRVRRYEL
jgi:hypothetical protein